MNNAGGVVTLVLIYLLVFGGLGIGALVSYILRGVGMYTLGKRRGMDYPWLAFIPYARTWFQGNCAAPCILVIRSLSPRGSGFW